MEIHDPDVLKSGTNRIGLPGDGGQKQALCAVTREEEKAEENLAAREEEKAVKDGGASSRKEGRGSLGGGLAAESSEDTRTTSGITRHSGGPGGSIPGLRPRSGESVASAGVWGRSQ
ncbi:hypothetical protein NDU88_004768 [Pleurodeles waltl]|uniref:Uncharacterized protein n=1 Tax=Pleurodeles waltl TaxID=8319 RepID=A0AAV7LJ50_PLEWA|nr:hypothetical protein NDU88_004768 [Pleurodeles waltl]